MPMHEYMFDQMGMQRVQVFEDAEGKNLTVLENQHIIGTLSAQEARETGREFLLSDTTTLKVQVINDQIQVQRNGLILSPAPATSEGMQPIVSSPAPSRGKRGGCLTTYLIFIMIATPIVVFLNIVLISATQAYVPDPYSGIIYLYPPLWVSIVYTLCDLSTGVGAIALFAWKRWGYYLIVANITVLCLATLFAGPTQWRNFLVLFALGILTFLLRRNGKWELFA